MEIWFGIVNGQISSNVDGVTPIVSFPDDNLSKHQWIFTKLGMCIDIVEIWFRIAYGQSSSMFELSACDTIMAGYYSFTFLFIHLSNSFFLSLFLWEMTQHN